MRYDYGVPLPVFVGHPFGALHTERCYGRAISHACETANANQSDVEQTIPGGYPVSSTASIMALPPACWKPFVTRFGSLP